MENIKELLNYSVSRNLDKIAYELDNRKISYSQLLEDVNALGTAMLDLGLKGKNIAILSENRYEWEMTYFTIVSGLGIVVPIDKTLPESEIERIIKNAKIDVVVCSKTYEDMVIGKTEYTILMDKEESKDNILSLKELIEKGKDSDKSKFENLEVDSKNVGTIMYTSGTTDEAKAVMLSQNGIATNIESAASVLGLTQDDRVLCVLPLNHVLEGLFGFLTSIYVGATRIYCDDLAEIATYIKEKNITFMCGVPAIYKMMYEQIEAEEYKGINILFSGGAPLSSSLKEAYKKLGIDLIQGYGLTETSPVVALENKENQKNGSVGKVIPGVNIKVNYDGELYVKGPNIMLGYFENDEETQKSLKDEYLCTGDLAKVDENGYLYIIGRKKDLIVLSNGKKVYPEELEGLINNLDGVKESFVCSIDELRLCAKIVTNEKEENVLKRIDKLNKELPDYKKIKEVIVKTKPLIKNVSGKILRDEEKLKVEKNLKAKYNDGYEEEDSIEDRIKVLVSSQLNKSASQIEITSNLVHDLGADSLDKVEIILKVEKEFDIKINKEDRRNITTVEDIVKYVENKE